MIMFIGIIISVAVFVSDIYTAVILLAYDKWSSEIDPAVPISISRWIFAGCIILSTLLVFVEFMVALRIYRGKNISRTYTNAVARRFYSIRGYSYFCLFGKITKSRNKTEYLALFVYFALKSWLKLLIADGPRQAINAMTLYSVLKVKDNFLGTVKEIATTSSTQALVLGVMTFSLTIWVMNMIEFLLALICALPLYIHIEKTCSGLEEYCYVRINSRIAKLVQKYHDRDLLELKKANKRLSKQPTLPVMFLNNSSNATLVNNNRGNSADDDDLTPLRPNTSVPQAGNIYGNSGVSAQETRVHQRKVSADYKLHKTDNQVARKPVVRFDQPVQRKPVGPPANYPPPRQTPTPGTRQDTQTPGSRQPAQTPFGPNRQNVPPPARPHTVDPMQAHANKPGRSLTQRNGDEGMRNHLANAWVHDKHPRAATAPASRPPNTPLNFEPHNYKQNASQDDTHVLNRQTSNATLTSTSSMADPPVQPEEIISYNPTASGQPFDRSKSTQSRLYENESEIFDYYQQVQIQYHEEEMLQYAERPNWYPPLPTTARGSDAKKSSNDDDDGFPEPTLPRLSTGTIVGKYYNNSQSANTSTSALLQPTVEEETSSGFTNAPFHQARQTPPVSAPTPAAKPKPPYPVLDRDRVEPASLFPRPHGPDEGWQAQAQPQTQTQTQQPPELVPSMSGPRPAVSNWSVNPFTQDAYQQPQLQPQPHQQQHSNQNQKQQQRLQQHQEIYYY